MNKLESIRKDKNLGVSFKASNSVKKYIFGDTIDELIDGLRKFNDGEFVNKFVATFPDLTEGQLEQLDDIMAKTSNAEEIVKYAKKRKKLSNRKDIEERLVELKKYCYIVEYATKCDVDNIDLLVDCISKEGSILEICKIAHARGADLIKLKDVILEKITCDSTEISACINFCSYCQEESDVITLEDVRKVEQLVIDNGDEREAKSCAKKIKGVNIERLQKRVEESGNAEAIFIFARDVEGADINSLRTAIEKAVDYDPYSFENSRYWREQFVNKFGPDLVEENKKRSIFRRKKN